MEKTVKINFNRKFYSAGCIEKSIRAYKGLADFSVTKTRGGFTVVLRNISDGLPADIEKEFANYALSIAHE